MKEELIGKKVRNTYPPIITGMLTDITKDGKAIVDGMETDRYITGFYEFKPQHGILEELLTVDISLECDDEWAWDKRKILIDQLLKLSLEEKDKVIKLLLEVTRVLFGMIEEPGIYSDGQEPIQKSSSYRFITKLIHTM